MSNNKLDDTLNKGLKSAKDALAEKMINLAQKESAQSQQETTFNVVFSGKFTKDEKLVITAMAKFFKQGHEATKRLLKAGQVIKPFNDKGPADKLAKMLNGIGLECKVVMETTGDEQSDASSLLEKVAFKLADSDTPKVHIPRPSTFTWQQWSIVGAVCTAILVVILWQIFKPSLIEGNSFASYEASVQNMLDRASDEDRVALKKSIDLLTGAGFEYQQHNTTGGNEEVAAGVAYSRVNGLSAKEIIAVAESDMDNQRGLFTQEIEQAEQEIIEAKKELSDLKKQNELLGLLVITEPKFLWKNSSTPEIILKLTNNSREKVRKVFFQGVLRNSKGKLLVSKPFTYETGVGIPPRGYKYVTFFPPTHEAWSTSVIKKQWRTVKFSATVENATNLRGKFLGIDLRPTRKKIATKKLRVKKLKQQLANIKF